MPTAAPSVSPISVFPSTTDEYMKLSNESPISVHRNRDRCGLPWASLPAGSLHPTLPARPQGNEGGGKGSERFGSMKPYDFAAKAEQSRMHEGPYILTNQTMIRYTPSYLRPFAFICGRSSLKGLDNLRVDFLSAELVFYQRDFPLGDEI